MKSFLCHNPYDIRFARFSPSAMAEFRAIRAMARAKAGLCPDSPAWDICVMYVEGAPDVMEVVTKDGPIKLDPKLTYSVSTGGANSPAAASSDNQDGGGI